MKRFINPDKSTWKSLTKRSSSSYDSLEPLAKSIFKTVEKDGDLAIMGYAYKYDKLHLESIMFSLYQISTVGK